MKKKISNAAFASLTLLGVLGIAGPALAQVAGGTTTVETNVTETTEIAMGWSVKKTLLGKSIYNDAGEKIGEVEDLIVSPDKNVSYVIVGAGGFVGIGRHDVAVPVTQIVNKSGKLVMANATKDSIKALPEFAYASDTSKRDAFVASAEKDVVQGKAALAGLETKTSSATAAAKAKMALDMTALQSDVKSVEAKLAEMKQAGAARWREFEVDLNAATARLRKSTDQATG